MGEGHSTPEGADFTRLRIAAGLSRRALAERAGVSKSSVERIERGLSATRAVLDALAGVLGEDVYAFVPEWPPLPRGDTPLAEARRLAGETVAQAAERAGVSDDTVRRAERGERLHPASAKRIADAFGLEVTDVLPVPNGAAA